MTVVDDQASALRELMRTRGAPRLPPGRAARFVAVASGKGGVGKTNTAVNVAFCLARRGRRVLLIDADLGTANADLLMGVVPRLTLTDAIDGRCELPDAAMSVGPRTRRGGDLRFIAGASGLSHVADLEAPARGRMIAALTGVEADCDHVIIDCGAGISRNVTSFAAAADELVVVTTPEPTSLTDAYALIKVICRDKPPASIGLVVNQVRSAAEARRVGERLAEVAARFLGVGVGCLGAVPRDEAVAEAVRKQRPVVEAFPHSRAAQAFSALAERLDRAAEPAGGRGGRLARFLGLFC